MAAATVVSPRISPQEPTPRLVVIVDDARILSRCDARKVSTYPRWGSDHFGRLGIDPQLHLSERVPIAQIARDLGISRNTVAKAVASAGPPGYSRPAVETSFGPFEVRVRGLLAATPSMPATVLAERVGWTGSATWFRQNVALIRPDYAPTDPADRIVYHPGDQVQCDLWFPEPHKRLSPTA